jgi:hypothetical protein
MVSTSGRKDLTISSTTKNASANNPQASQTQPCQPPGAIGCPTVTTAIAAMRLLRLPPLNVATNLPLLPGMMPPLRWTGADAAAAPAPAANALLPCRCRT